MDFDSAYEIAKGIVWDLKPAFDRLEIAGSLRRGVEEVKDLEIVGIPRYDFTFDLFGVKRKVAVYPGLDQVFKLGRMIKNGDRYKQIHLYKWDINLDLFIVRDPAQWGVIFAIRTGPAEFSKKIVTPRKYGGFLPSNCKVKDGAVWRDGKIIPMDEEIDFLTFLGLGWIDPGDRADPGRILESMKMRKKNE